MKSVSRTTHKFCLFVDFILTIGHFFHQINNWPVWIQSRYPPQLISWWKFLKLGGPAPYPIITMLWNIDINSNIFLSSWKQTRVTPIYKQSNKSNVHNFRPISVLPILYEIVEKHAHIYLYKFLNAHNLLSNRQSGFRTKHPCQNALLIILEEWPHELLNGKFVSQSW